MPETVSPSPEPDAAVSTGSGHGKDAAPPPDGAQSAGTGGLGTQADQKGSSASGGAPYTLTPEGDSDEQGPAGT